MAKSFSLLGKALLAVRERFAELLPSEVLVSAAGHLVAPHVQAIATKKS